MDGANGELHALALTTRIPVTAEDIKQS